MKRRFLAALFACALTMPVIGSCGIPGAEQPRLIVGTTDQLTYNAEAPYPLDPAAAYDVGAWNLMRNAFQTLLRTPHTGSAPVPDAAEECYFTGRKKTRYSCVLREDLQFSDGEPLTARDVKHSIDRVLRIRYDGGPFGLLTNVAKVIVQDDRHVTFELKRPDATFPYKLSTPAASIVSDKYYPSDELRSKFAVDGSGPYTMTVRAQENRGKSVVFERNDAYKGALTVRNSGVELKIFETPEKMGEALEAGEIDMMTRTVTSSLVRRLKWRDDDDIEFYESPGLEIRYLVFDSKHPAVAKKSIRQAIAQVINRDRIVGKVYPDSAHELYSIIPAHMPGHVNSFFNKYSDPSVEKAAELLATDGVEIPVPLTLHYTTDHYGNATEREFEEIQQQLNATGLFNVNIKGTEWSRFGKERLDSKYAVYGMGWFPDFPDADGFISPFLGEGNHFNLKAGSLITDVLLPREQRQTDRADAIDDLERIQDVVAEDVWFLPLWQGTQQIASQDYVTGVERAVNTSSDLQLWELRRGLGSD